MELANRNVVEVGIDNAQRGLASIPKASARSNEQKVFAYSIFCATITLVGAKFCFT